jgi:yecA family protein
MTPHPLNDAEFDSLSGVLKQFGGKQAINVEQLDGFLAALICYPSDIPKAEYLPEIWGDEMINDEAFAAQPIVQDFLSLVARHKTPSRISWDQAMSSPQCFWRVKTASIMATIGQMDSFAE